MRCCNKSYWTQPAAHLPAETLNGIFVNPGFGKVAVAMDGENPVMRLETSGLRAEAGETCVLQVALLKQ
jgi:hypothetical protein